VRTMKNGRNALGCRYSCRACSACIAAMRRALSTRSRAPQRRSRQRAIPSSSTSRTARTGSGTFLIKGSIPRAPRRGRHPRDDLLVRRARAGVTGNIIESVTDVLTTVPNTPVGNKYELVEFVSDGNHFDGDLSRHNVQNFPDAAAEPSPVLAVRADLKVPVTTAGIALSAWIGVAGTMSQALGEHRAASGTASPPFISPTIADPGAISLNPGALA